MPVSKDLGIVDPVRGASKLVCCCNSQEHQDCITSLSSVAEASLTNEIKQLHKTIKEIYNSIKKLCNSIEEKDRVIIKLNNLIKEKDHANIELNNEIKEKDDGMTKQRAKTNEKGTTMIRNLSFDLEILQHKISALPAPLFSFKLLHAHATNAPNHRQRSASHRQC